MASNEELEALGIIQKDVDESSNVAKAKKVGTPIVKTGKQPSARQQMNAMVVGNNYESMKNNEGVILTTTNTIEGYNISDYIGIVSGTDIYLVGGIFGGGLVNQEVLYSTALATATRHIKANAEAIGADAVIGIQNNIASPGGANNMIVIVTGTAVKITKKS